MYEQLPGKTHILRNTGLRLQQVAPLLGPPFMHPGGRGGTALWEPGVLVVVEGELRSSLVEQEQFPIVGWQRGGAWSSWAAHGGTTSLLPCPLGFSLLFS